KHFWDERFPVYRDWKKSWYREYIRRGGFFTKTGFWIQGAYRRNQVINSPVQAAAFHCLLWSLIKLQKRMKKKKMRSKIVGQIHDSIVGDIHKNEVEDYLKMAKQTMTVDLPKAWKWIKIPLEIEAEVAPIDGSWYDKKEVKI